MQISELNSIASNEYLIKNVFDTFNKLQNASNNYDYETKVNPLIKELNEAITLVLLSIGVPRKYIIWFILIFTKILTIKILSYTFKTRKQKLKTVPSVLSVELVKTYKYTIPNLLKQTLT